MTQSTVDTRVPATPPFSLETLRRGALVSSAALMGFGLILWIAANWDAVGKTGRFGIVAAALAAGGLGAMLRPLFTTAGLLVAFLATGAMLSLIGQTYQTGADAWQLFALWAALGLPFALAARSDVLWGPWVAVAMTGLALWQSTTELARMFQIFSRADAQMSSQLPILLAGWVPALGVCALLAPGSIADSIAGNRRWAFRLAMLLTMANVTTWGVAGMLLGAQPLVGFSISALIVLAALGAWQALRTPFDSLLIAGAALAIDVVMISGFARAILPSAHSSGAAAYFMVGIGAALIVAASVVVVLHLLRSHESPSAGAMPKSLPPASAQRPWPVVVLSAAGALLAAIPLIVALGVFLGHALLNKGPSAWIFGFIAASGGIVAMRQARSLFVEQLAAIAFATGVALFVYALFRDLPVSMAGFVLGGMALALAVWIGKPWLAGLLGAIGACGLAIGLTHLTGGAAHPGTRAYLMTWGLLAAAWAFAIRTYDTNRDWLEPLPSTPTLDAIAAGACVAILLALSVGSGQTFLLDGMLGMRGTRVHNPSDAALIWLTPQRVLSVTLAVAAAVVLGSSAVMRSTLGVAVSFVGVALAAFMPSLGPVALVLAIAATTARRGIAILAAVAVLWIFGNFYYYLDFTLTQKAAILAAAGGIIAVLVLATGTTATLGTLQQSSVEATAGAAATQPLAAVVPMSIRSLAAVGLLAAGGLSAQAIQSKEALIRDGAPVFVELAPVDPRSLMQGDYMALRFRLPDGGLRHQPAGVARPHAIGKIDETGVARLTRIGNAHDIVGRDEIRIELTPDKRGWTLVTNAWFFNEGDAKKWEAARYGEFRVLPDGRALLVSLADKDRLAIK